MAGILIIAHAPFATALRDCVAHIYGGLPARIGCVDVEAASDPAQVLATARAELDRLMEDNGVLVLTDMFGATPANIAAQLGANPAVRVLAGVNLPMLVRAVCYRVTPLDTLVDKALSGGSKGIHGIAPGAPQSASCPQAIPCDLPCGESLARAIEVPEALADLSTTQARQTPR
jgi:PTS system ascorbate-specific IIA component